MSVGVRTRRFSVEEYHQMVQAGILKEDDRLELIEGEIVEMVPIGPRHALCVDRLNWLLGSSLAERAIIRVQGPISLGPRFEPQPDLALFRLPMTRYTESHPGPADIFLVIEVAETSIDEDRARKIPLYAQAGIRETWLVNLPTQTIETYAAPTPDGYQAVRTVGRGQFIAPEAFSNLSFAVDEILG